MRRAGWAVVIWGVYNTLLATLLWAFPREPALSYAIAYSMGLSCVAFGLWLVRRGRRRGEAVEFDTGTRMLADLSPPTALLGIALSAMAASTELGLWLGLVGAGTAVFALSGLLRERRAMRRDARGGSAREER